MASRQEPQSTPGRPPVPFRLALALGNPERERALLPSLAESGEFAVAERCLAADQLLVCLQHGQVDAALVAADLHRLTESALAELMRARTPVVLLAARPGDERWRGFPGPVLPLEAEPATTRQALLAALRGERPRPVPPREEPAAQPAESVAWPAEAPATELAVLAVASGPGSPGRTTVAIGLAAALGAVAPTILVDADLVGPAVAAYLDLDPTRNLYLLAHAEPGTRREWERALAQETQPLGPRCPHAVALCGVPKPELRTAIGPRFFERLVAELRDRYRYVVLDVGADLLVAEAAVHRSALGLSDQVLLVASTDLVGLRHARTALGLLRAHVPVDPERVALILNRHDRRYHHGRSEIEWALGVPAAAVIPFDHGSMQRALGAQRPLVLDGRSRAGRALLDLAERVHGGEVVLPPEPTADARPRWRRWLAQVRLPWPRRVGVVAPTKEAAYGDDVAAG
jgi:MinD-like ATPase involved in chromosome partitioning or flagellar assembly